MKILQIVGLCIFIFGCLLYLIRAVMAKSSFDRLTLAAVVCLLIGLALVAIPAVLNPETCSICEKVIEDKWDFCPYCGTPICTP